MSLELDATMTAAGAAPPATAALGPGTMLAHFRIDGLLGKGGMGEVYRATDLALDRPVALKVLPAAVAADPARRERLFREARSQARLAHPNVCHIYYVGQERDVVFFAMELVAGETLAQRLASGPLPPAQAIELVRQAALGLREAHRHGFTHRDVKPSNLMLDREGRVKVVDFGLVKAMDAAPGDGDGGSSSSEETGLVGTPLYMAPEQAAGEAIDVRSDIYALGATLHHLIAGRPPFEGQSQDELATRHREEPRPRLAATTPRGRALSTVDEVIARMMAKRPADRFADYDELIAELERVSPARTRPAGFWVRALALSIDFMLVALLAVPAQLAASALRFELGGNVVFVLAPIYTVLGLSRWGTTVGRRLLEIEVVTVRGMRRPPIAVAAMREAIELGPFALVGALSAVGGTVDKIASGLGAVALVYGVAAMAYAALRTPDKRPLWDRVAGTMTRYRVAA